MDFLTFALSSKTSPSLPSIIIMKKIPSLEPGQQSFRMKYQTSWRPSGFAMLEIADLSHLNISLKLMIKQKVGRKGITIIFCDQI